MATKSKNNKNLDGDINAFSYVELLEKLRKPIEPKRLSTKIISGDKIPFVNITDCKDILDERIGGHRWESSIKSCQLTDVGCSVVVEIRVHSSDGMFAHDGTGFAKASVYYGDPPSNAYAQAFRRALEGFGFCRELWRQELSEEQQSSIATTEQVAELHELLDELNNLIIENDTGGEQRTETAVASHYSDGNAELFGEMMYLDAVKATDGLKGLIRKKSQGKKK